MLALVACITSAAAQPYLPGSGFAPLLCLHVEVLNSKHNIRTTDQGGPYNLTLVPTQVAEIRGASSSATSSVLDTCHLLLLA